MRPAELPLDDLVSRFAEATLPHDQWTHAAHLRVGAWHVHHLGAAEALRTLRGAIRALNDRHGTANSDASGYHETVTAAYVHLLGEYLRTFADEVPLGPRVEALLAGPLAERDVLLRFWSRDVLMSPRARREWVAPDRSPLALPA